MNKVLCSVLSVACLVSILELVECRQQRLVVKGTLMCGNRTYSGATVKVVSKRVGFDSELGQMESDAKGQFYIDGTSDEFFNLNGQVKIYHDCDDYLPCQRRLVYKIPSNYINPPGGANPKVLNIGVANLALRSKSEERNCF